MLNNEHNRGQRILDAIEQLDSDLIYEAEMQPPEKKRFNFGLIPAAIAAAILITASMMLVLHRGDEPIPPETTLPHEATLPPTTTLSPAESILPGDYPYAHVIWEGVVYQKISGIIATPGDILGVVSIDSRGSAEFDETKIASNCVAVGEGIFRAGGFNPEYLIAAYDDTGKICNFVRTAHIESTNSLGGRKLGEILPALKEIKSVKLLYMGEEYYTPIKDNLWIPYFIDTCLASGIFTEKPRPGTETGLTSDALTDETLADDGEPITIECFLGEGLYYSFCLYENSYGSCVGETIRVPDGLYEQVVDYYNNLPANTLGKGLDGEQAYSPFYGGLFGISKTLSDLIPPEDVNHYFYELFADSFDFNVRSFCRYFGITEEQYRASLTHYENTALYGTGGQYKLNHYPAGVYGSYDDFINTFVGRAFRDDYQTEECIPGPDCPHTFTYHTITDEMIDLVGEDKYADFRAKYYGTEEFNIMHFITYFGLTRAEIERALEESIDPLPAYKVEYLFGDGEMQKEYFFIKSAQTTESPEELQFSSGGVTVSPTMVFAHRMLWTDEGWLSGTGPYAAIAIREHADTIPTLTVRSEIAAHLAPDQTITQVTVLDKNFNGGPLTDVQVGHQLNNLHYLPADGDYYYVAVTITRQGRFIESEQMYEYYADYALFRVIIDPNRLR